MLEQLKNQKNEFNLLRDGFKNQHTQVHKQGLPDNAEQYVDFNPDS